MTTRLVWATTSFLLSGCIAPLLVAPGDISESSDISTGGIAALVRGSTRGLMEPNSCYIDQPAKTKELVVDAGPISIIASCFYYGTYGPSTRSFAGVAINTQTGHEYELRRTDTEVFRGLDVIDLSDNRRLIARRPLLRTRTDATMSNGKAFVFVNATLGRGSLGSVTCELQMSSSAAASEYWPVTTNWYSGSSKWIIEPGRLAIDVNCAEWSSNFGPMKSEVKNRYQTEVEFVPEAGRLYAIGLQSAGNACIQVIDVTDENDKTIECKEAQLLEEL